ncbi:hypothetical protein NDU88_001317 [Pleurodeles waltl]|uniref:Uncharacterized protein n=1 Tax=Pleurodeles waltl TaxID=8319 RepID=A0AAV7U824_PLEWA|nr:hypothetical protein NDU88_001317 [Pleurodeles waltl]
MHFHVVMPVEGGKYAHEQNCRSGQAGKQRVSPCVPDPRCGLPTGGERGPPEGRGCGARATAAASGDAGVNAASGLPRSRGLRCGATRARGASRGRRKDRPSTASAPRVLERRSAPSCGGGERGPRGKRTTREPGLEDDHDEHDGTEKNRQRSTIPRGLNSI